MRFIRINTKIVNYILITCGIFASFATYFLIYTIKDQAIPDPDKVMGLVLVDIVLVFIITVLLVRKFFRLIVKKRSVMGFKLQRNIVLMFGGVAALPTIIVAVFSIWFFHKGLQTWFDQSVVRALDQAFHISEGYIEEKKNKMKESAIFMAEDLEEAYKGHLFENYLQEVLDEQSALRSLDEALVFQATTNNVYAQTAFSFPFILSTIQNQELEAAKRGEIVVLQEYQNKIRVLVKINTSEQIYLLIGKLLDRNIVNYVNQTNSAANTYKNLKNNMDSLTVKFSIIFMVGAMLLLVTAISIGVIFANNMVLKLKKLLQGTAKVERGDLTVQLSFTEDDGDELSILAQGFNRMVMKLNQQRQDLVIAQRAMAWSDVARRVAHEIKNPLTPVQLATERLMKKFADQVDDKEQFNRYINSILRNITDINHIVTEFSKFAKLPSPVFAEMELVSVLEEIVKARQSLNENIEYIFTTNVKNLDFIGDVKQINQIMNNLLRNSEEELKNIKGQPKVEISLELKLNLVKIFISDNGKGFSKSILTKVTKPYVTTRLHGMGLGLSIVKKIVEEHFGIMKTYNSPMGGACVELEFDIAQLRNRLNN